MTRWRIASFVAVVALVLSVLAGTGSAASADTDADRGERIELSGVGRITWGPCDDPTLIDFGAECGMLDVPLDYARPKGPAIQLAVSRLRHTVPDEDYQGIMLVNPGGPGGSGLLYAILSGFVPGGAGEAYDWIGFDPRGVGSSVPALSCIPEYSAGPRPPYDPFSQAVKRAWLEKAWGYAEACGRNGGELLDHLKTIDNVKDMNAIRHSLGEKQLNFYGVSYGTYLGQVFASVYPKKVRRMVLDSNVDPRKVWYEANLEQDVAFEKVFQLFLDWVARNDDAYHLGTSGDAVEAAYYRTKDALAAQPVGQLGPAEWADVFVTGYSQATWPDVATSFAAFVNDGDAGPITDLFLGFTDTVDDNGYAMYLATLCTDARWPQRWSTWQRDSVRVAQEAPFVTWGNTWFNAPCLFWPAEAGQPVEVRGKQAPPVLLVDETLDAATPFSGSLEVRKRFRSSSLIAVDGGTSHGSALLGGNACVDDGIAAYLRDGTLPDRQRGQGPDLVCAATPEPVPTPSPAGSAAAGLVGSGVGATR